jgi:hypothetical protein
MIVDTRKDIIKNSIEYYKKSKKELLDKIMNQKIHEEEKSLENRENDLMFWKRQYDDIIHM